MDRTRRAYLAAAGAGVGALLLFRHRGVVAAAERSDAVTVVRGADNLPTVTAALPAATGTDLAAWQAQVGQPIGLAASGRRLAATVVAVTPVARPLPPARPPAPSRFWGWFSGSDRSASAPAAAGAAGTSAAASLPRGVRPYAYSVLIAVESGTAPTADTLMDLDRPIEGLRQLFVQPATAIAGKPMVVAWFG